jgi:hypothetical protein
MTAKEDWLMLALKLILTPTLVGIVSIVGRRWGPAVSGWLVGLPLTSAPVSLFFALDQGNAFASHAAQSTMAGLISVAAFCLIYSWLSFRVNWLCCWLAGWCVFFASTFILEQISLPLALSFVGIMSFLAVALKLLPKNGPDIIATNPPAWEIIARMLLATAFLLLLTGLASSLGPHLSGLLTPLPIYATVLGIFTHHFYGGSAARQLLRGVVFGSFAFAVFFLIVAGTIERVGIAAAFSFALLGAVLTQGCSLWLLKRYRVS